MELKKIFDAESKSTWDVFDRGTGFYIPPYQRQYDWEVAPQLSVVIRGSVE